MLRDLLERRLEYAQRDGERFFDAAQNARLVADAERYYRAMYYGSAASWNLRDQHMFDTLAALLAFHGPSAKASCGSTTRTSATPRATEMGARGEHNVGQLCRRAFGDGAYLVGFGTDHGTVAAARDWDEPMEIMACARAPRQLRARCSTKRRARVPAPSARPARAAVRDELVAAAARARDRRRLPAGDRARRATTSRPSLPQQFDEYIWFDETEAVTPLRGPAAPGLPETYPFGP